MASFAEIHVVGLIFHQQARLGRGVRLVTASAAYGCDHLFGCGIDDILDRMVGGRVTKPVFQRKQGHFGKVVFGQANLTVKDRDQVLFFQLGGRRLGAVTFQAQLVLALGSQQLGIFAAVRLVAGGAALFVGRLMQVALLLEFGLIAVAGEAGAHRIGADEAGRLAGVGTMAIGAIALSARMLHLGVLDLFSLLIVTGDAEFFHAGSSEDDFSILGRQVAGIAGFGFERTVLESAHQLGSGRLVRIVTAQAIGLFDGLILMRLGHLGILGIVAFGAEGRAGLGEVIAKFSVGRGAGLVGHVTGFAASIERGVTAPAGGNVETLVMTLQAQIGSLGCAISGLQQLIFDLRSVGIMALKAIPDRRTMDAALDLGSVHSGVALEAQLDGRDGGELDARHILTNPNLVAAHAAGRDGRVHCFAFGFVFVAGGALGGVGSGFEGYGVRFSLRGNRRRQH